ncbi:hypothetical protein F1880_010297 [Penicillium rolfsii]|nr:hypothetical protein F1880_010297 [Penicillium rolfsii]
MEEDNKLQKLRLQGWGWTAMSQELPGRSSIACRLRFQRILSQPSNRDQNREERLAQADKG